MMQKKVYSNCRNLNMFFRDKKSYDFAKEHFENHNTKVHLSPDIALYYDEMKTKSVKEDLMICLRNDREKETQQNIINWSKKYAENNSMKLTITDTVQKNSVPLWMRDKKIQSKTNEFRNSKIVVTDRLHGMIFAVIANTKCVVFDNLTNKVSGVHSLWLKNNPNIVFLSKDCSEEELTFAISNLLSLNNESSNWRQEILSSFHSMRFVIESE